ncbi:MAG: flagellar capping protein [Lachnospiraceae bacterium]|nr:flagellar capping protein [Lachnospiraceae bacterium]
MSAIINNHEVYNYYLSTYAPTAGNSRYDSHKKSELKNVYSRIVNSSKDAPLYKIPSGSEVTKFAIDLKENARQTQNLVSSLQSDGDDIENVFHRKIATSSNEEAVAVEYMAASDTSGTTGFSLGVKDLARPQINRGNFLPANGHSLKEGAHVFDLDTTQNSYEFQFNVGAHDTNRDIQQRISRLINTSNLGLSARVLDRGDGQSALEISSKHTGLAQGEDYLFDIHTDNAPDELNILGINNVAQEASNSTFTLNGREHHSQSNNFTINRAFDITLHAPTPDEEPAQIGFKEKAEAMADSIYDLVNAFNGFVTIGRQYAASHHNSQLIGEMGRLYRSMRDDLASVGVVSNEDQTLDLDREQIASAVTSEDSKSAFGILNRFKNAVSRQANKTAIDPLNYVDKVPITYKNPGKGLVAPYATSRYAGLLIDQTL